MNILQTIEGLFIAEQEAAAGLAVSDPNTPVDALLPTSMQIKGIGTVKDLKTGQSKRIDLVGFVFQKEP